MQVQQESFGTAALNFSDGMRIDAMECRELLEEFGKGLRDATSFYLEHLRRVQSSQTVTIVVDEFLAAKEADGASARYFGDLRVRLQRFTLTFGKEVIATITARQITDWLRSLGVGVSPEIPFDGDWPLFSILRGVRAIWR